MDSMYKVFENGVAQMGAVGLLVIALITVIWWLRTDSKQKDSEIKGEISKREELLRETLNHHHEMISTIKSLGESLATIMHRIEEIVDRIEDKVDDKRSIRKNS